MMVRCGVERHDGAVLIQPPDSGALTEPMWPTFDRTRRRLLGGDPATDSGRTTDAIDADGALDALDAAGDPAGPTSAPTGAQDCILAIGRQEVQRLADALQALLGPGTDRPDTPARLEAALATAVGRLGGGGLPRVTRRPPGLYTPEAWQVHLVAVQPAVSDAIRGAIRTGVFA